MSDPKYPNVHVKLTETDGNAFMVMGAVTRAMKRKGISTAEQNEYREAATAGDYDNLLRVSCEWVTVS